jgi:hypothetical protein
VRRLSGPMSDMMIQVMCIGWIRYAKS